jgi:hypothetical protein
MTEEKTLADVPRKKKTVRILISFEMDREVPEEWDQNQVEFYYNESSHCMGNEIAYEHRAIQKQKNTCDFCHRCSVKVISMNPEPKEDEL